MLLLPENPIQKGRKLPMSIQQRRGTTMIRPRKEAGMTLQASVSIRPTIVLATLRVHSRLRETLMQHLTGNNHHRTTRMTKTTTTPARRVKPTPSPPATLPVSWNSWSVPVPSQSMSGTGKEMPARAKSTRSRTLSPGSSGLRRVPATAKRQAAAEGSGTGAPVRCHPLCCARNAFRRQRRRQSSQRWSSVRS